MNWLESTLSITSTGILRWRFDQVMPCQTSPVPFRDAITYQCVALILYYVIITSSIYDFMAWTVLESGLGDLPLNRDFLESEVKIRTSGSNRQLYVCAVHRVMQHCCPDTGVDSLFAGLYYITWFLGNPRINRSTNYIHQQVRYLNHSLL